MLSGKFNVGFPAWSPDGSTLIYRVWGDDKSKESRGLHFTLDYPDVNATAALDTVAKRGVLPHLRGR